MDKGNLKSKSCLVADYGQFVELAPRLARDFGEVKLFTPWMAGRPSAAPAFVGKGIDGVKRVEYFWDHVPDADVVMFPGPFMADMAEVCAGKFHKPVWSNRRADAIDMDRWGTRKLQRSLGIDTPKTKRFLGIDELEDYLETTKNKWVKVSTFSGDIAAWHHDTRYASATRLNVMRSQAGPMANQYEFTVEDHVEGLEVAYDGFTVRGEIPEAAHWGFEAPGGAAYIGQFAPTGDLPKAIQSHIRRMASVFKTESATGFVSSRHLYENEDRDIILAVSISASSPSFEAIMEGYANLSEVMWEAANNREPSIRSAGQFVAAATLRCPMAATDWVPIEIPSRIDQWVKIRNKAVIDGMVYHVPTHSGGIDIGAVVAVADEPEDAMQLVISRAAMVKGYMVDCCVDAFDGLHDVAIKAKEYGVEW